MRGLSQCLAREFQPLGVHVAHVVIDGVVGDATEERGRIGSSGASEEERIYWEVGQMKAEAVAQTYWQLHIQDPSAWTQELDLRPVTSSFPSSSSSTA